MNNFIAKNVVILALHDAVGDYGLVMPANCKIIMPDYLMPVTYNYDHTKPAGQGKLTRADDKVLVTLFLRSTMKDTLEAMRLIKLLAPVIEAKILDINDGRVSAMEIVGISLIPDMEDELRIIGNKLQCADATTKRRLH